MLLIVCKSNLQTRGVSEPPTCVREGSLSRQTKRSPTTSESYAGVSYTGSLDVSPILWDLIIDALHLEKKLKSEAVKQFC